jgi:hypothetical protein
MRDETTKEFDQLRDHAGPSGLMTSPEARAVAAGSTRFRRMRWVPDPTAKVTLGPRSPENQVFVRT